MADRFRGCETPHPQPRQNAVSELTEYILTDNCSDRLVPKWAEMLEGMRKKWRKEGLMKVKK